MRDEEPNGKKTVASNPAYQGYAIALEFVIYVIVCGAIGYGIDYLTGNTSKVAMTTGFILGILAGGYRFITQAIKASKPRGK